MQRGYVPRAPPSPTINIVHNHYPQGQEKTTVEITEDTELLHVEHRDHVEMIEGHLTPQQPSQFSNDHAKKTNTVKKEESKSDSSSKKEESKSVSSLKKEESKSESS